MKTTFKGYIEVDMNSVFFIPRYYKGFHTSNEIYELKDGIDADQFVIGEEYDITDLVK